MKHEWLGVAIVALTMAGCSQNEVTDVNDTLSKKNEISFDLSTGKTRVADATVGTMQNNTDGFTVFATQNLVGSEVLVDNKQYHYDAGTWKWKGIIGDDIPKWPTDTKHYPVNFYAYYPHDLLTSDALTKDDLDKEIQVKAIDQQIDILAAAQSNIVVKPANSRIIFTFEHILSKIAFKAEVVQNARAYIQSVSVNQVKDTRTFDFRSLAWAGDATTAASYIFRKSPDTGKIQVEIAGGSSVAIKGDNNNEAMMLMPQAISGNAWAPAIDPTGTQQSITDLSTKANIQMIYRMTAGNGDMVGYTDATQHPDWGSSEYAKNNPTYSDGLYIKVAYALGVASWLKGKSYTYEFKLGTPGASGGYLIDDTFYDENGKETDLKVRHPGGGGGPIDPGQPPFETGGNIDFDIIVKEWDTTHGDANKPLN